MIRETIDSTSRILRDTVFRSTETITDSNEADQFVYTEETCINERVVKWKHVWRLTGRGNISVVLTPHETHLTSEERSELITQWYNEIEDAQPLTWTFQENLQMEVNGTVLRQETVLNRHTSEITRKRFIGDRSITVTMRQDSAENEMTGSELRARYLELTAFNEEWAQLWRPDG